MATLPPVSGLLKHQLYFRDPQTDREQNIVMTFWTWRNENPVPQIRVDYEAGAIKTWSQATAFRNRLVNDTWSTWVKTWDMGQTPPSRYAPLRIWPVVAGLNTDRWTPTVSSIVALRTQAVGSSTRNRQNGRIHHPFPPIGDIVDGIWGSTHRTDMQTAYHALRDVLKPAASANSGTWVVPSFFEGGALRVGGPLLPAVNHVICRPQPGTQRRRQARPGPYARGA